METNDPSHLEPFVGLGLRDTRKRFWPFETRPNVLRKLDSDAQGTSVMRPPKILGELMLLIEGDKRSEQWATKLAYAEKNAPPFFIPKNVYLLGMMNTADRSLSLVDYALRRRFRFISLEPELGSQGFADFLRQRGVPDHIISRIKMRVGELNRFIGDKSRSGLE